MELFQTGKIIVQVKIIIRLFSKSEEIDLLRN